MHNKLWAILGVLALVSLQACAVHPPAPTWTAVPAAVTVNTPTRTIPQTLTPAATTKALPTFTRSEPSPTPTGTVSPTPLPVPIPTQTTTAQVKENEPCADSPNDYDMQRDTLLTYVDQHKLPVRAMQVSPLTHPKISQYRSEIVSRYGFNACGLVAAAAALGGQDWLVWVEEIAQASGDAYGPETGIQPSPYVEALRRVWGREAVQEENEWSLCALYQALEDGSIVIVDIQVGSSQNERPEAPTIQPPNYAHFARILGIDLSRETIYVENTLKGNSSYWELSITEFWQVWQYPETGVSLPAPNPEEVTRWAVIIQPPEYSAETHLRGKYG